MNTEPPESALEQASRAGVAESSPRACLELYAGTPDDEANQGGFMRKLARLLGLAAVLALGPGGVARAVPPEHFPVEHVDGTFTIEGEWALSGVTVHVEGDLRHTQFFDQAGTEIRDLTVFPNSRVTFTNTETGKSISTVSPAVEHVTINPDGLVPLSRSRGFRVT